MTKFFRGKLAMLLLISVSLVALIVAITYRSNQNTPPPAREPVKADVYYANDQLFVIIVNDSNYDWGSVILDPCPAESKWIKVNKHVINRLRTCSQGEFESPRVVHVEQVRAQEAVLVPWFKFMNVSVEAFCLAAYHNGNRELINFCDIHMRPIPTIFPSDDLTPLKRMRIAVTTKEASRQLSDEIFDVKPYTPGIQKLVDDVINQAFYIYKMFLLDPPFLRIPNFTQRLEEFEKADRQRSR